jgi:hypothetical protein
MDGTLIAGDQEGEMKKKPMDDPFLRTLSQQSLDLLATRRIFFGHQSVGQNIVDGLMDILALYPNIKLHTHEGTRSEDFRSPGLFHAAIGKNLDPRSKIDHFGQILESGIGQIADIAFFKLCYVDIHQHTDIQTLFDYFEKKVTALIMGFPNLRIVIVTVPLTTIPAGIVADLKRALGRGLGERAGNIRRNLFNQMLKKRFGGSVFDLAESEATISGQRKATFRMNQTSFYFLNRAYTDDGGHLNALGRRAVAADLLHFLAGISDKSAAGKF